MYTISVGNAFGHSIYTDLAVQEITEGVNAAFDNIDRIFAEYHQSLLSPEHMEAELFGEAKKEEPVPQQAPQQSAPSKGIVASLGAAIRGLISAFGQMIQRLGDAFMSNDARLRKQQEEIQRQLAANPDLKKKVMALSAEGVLDIKDMRDINQLSEEVDKILAEKDPKTIRGKLEKLKKEWDDPNGKFLKRVAAAGTVVGLAATCYKLYGDLKKGREDTIACGKKRQDTLKTLNDIIEKQHNTGPVTSKEQLDNMKRINNSSDWAKTVTAAEAKLALIKFEQGCCNDAINILHHNYGQCSKGEKIIMRFFGNKKNKEVAYNKSPFQQAIKNAEASKTIDTFTRVASNVADATVKRSSPKGSGKKDKK